MSVEQGFDGVAVIQFGEYIATLNSETDEFQCSPSNPPLQLKLNIFLHSIKRDYVPDRVGYWAESTARKFNGRILHVERMIVDDHYDPDVIN
jgi:hypothetical protein